MSGKYDPLLDRIIESAKPAVAIVIIYAIAFYMGWDKPYWAAVSAASVNLLTHGMTLYRGLIRVAGTIVGGFTGLAIIALFPQERWAYQIAAMIPIIIFGYGCCGKNDYFYVVCGITFMVVMAVAWTVPDWSSEDAHQIVMLRVTQTWMGSLIMVLINVFVWPKSHLRDFEHLARAGWENQQQIFDALRRAMSSEDTGAQAQELRLQDVEIQEQIHFVLHMAEHDSFEIIETGHDWHDFLHMQADQLGALESIREGLPDVQGLELTTFLPNLDELCSELEQRYEQTKLLLARETPSSEPRPVIVMVDEAKLQALPAFQQAAVTAIKSRLEDLEALSRSLFDCMARIRLWGPVADQHGAQDAHNGHGAHHGLGGHGSHGPWLVIDPDRALSATANVVTIWIAFFCWIYINDIPLGPLHWAMTGIFTFIMGYRGEVTWKEYHWSWAVGTIVAGICYVFLMQEATSYVELSVIIFFSCFIMFFVLYPLPHPVGRMFALISYTIVLSAENEQSYSLEHFIIYVLWLFFVISLSLAVRACFFYPRAEKNFLRLYDRFFRHAHLLVSAHGPNGPRQQGFFDRLRMVFYGFDLTESPRKCALYASGMDAKMLMTGRGTIDYSGLGTPPEKTQELVLSLYLLAYRVKELVAARELPRMDVVEDQLRDEKQDWLQLIEDWFRHKADNPEAVMDLTADLPARLTELEPRIEEAFASVDQRAFSAQDSENFYRLLSSYRGLSEAVVNFAQIANTFDFARWRATRF